MKERLYVEYLFIKNKILLLLVLFLIKVAKELRKLSLYLYINEKISGKRIKSLMDLSLSIHRSALVLLRRVKN